MIASKHIDAIVAALVVLALAAVAAAMIFAGKLSGSGGVEMEYETELFGASDAITVNIVMDEDDWNKMLENAADEEYYACDVVINGTTISSVGIRTKGDTDVSASGTGGTAQRYSFRIKFDEYVDGQTCFGLDELVLNNGSSDASSMKEALTYDMFAYLGADSPLYNYASVSVNGDYRGCYLALEAVDESFCLRNYGVDYGELYKPESSDADDAEGADLNYIDDDLGSYSAIWDGAETKISKKDKKRVVKALKNISEGEDVGEYMDVDNVLKYLAVQTFVVNLDGLAGSEDENYYLYESGGMLNLIPWDYDLAFGGTQGSTASEVVNFPIDTPFTTGLESRGFFAALLENDEYLAKYHEYLRQLAEEYAEGGGLDAAVTRIRSQIDTLVAADPTAFYTQSEYETAVETLENVIRLRAESVLGQLDGTIPSTAAGQSADASALVDCTGIDLSSMGTENSAASSGAQG
jgi:spore coat protein CotH